MLIPILMAGTFAVERALTLIGILQTNPPIPSTWASNLTTIRLLAQALPMLGLLGTVIGMAHVFGALGLHQLVDSQRLSEGISEALVCTEIGLVLAIPTMLMHTLLSNRTPTPSGLDPESYPQFFSIRHTLTLILRSGLALLIVLTVVVLVSIISTLSWHQTVPPKIIEVSVTSVSEPTPSPQQVPLSPPPVAPHTAQAPSVESPLVPTRTATTHPTPALPLQTPIVAMSQADAPPQLIEKMNPTYPPIAREAGVECTLLLAMVVNENGTVDSAEVLKVSTPGFGFESSALQAAYQMTFKPITQNGMPVRAKIYYPLRFILKE